LIWGLEKRKRSKMAEETNKLVREEENWNS